MIRYIKLVGIKNDEAVLDFMERIRDEIENDSIDFEEIDPPPSFEWTELKELDITFDETTSCLLLGTMFSDNHILPSHVSHRSPTQARYPETHYCFIPMPSMPEEDQGPEDVDWVKRFVAECYCQASMELEPDADIIAWAEKYVDKERLTHLSSFGFNVKAARQLMEAEKGK